ncbi:MAG TPA: DNA repair protein RadC [Chlamydiales bacterium]|nr:DNA repair protein RadC [Chlamydiales bacterium]
MSSFKNLPEGEKPRERLEKIGASSLSLVELIAILLGHGTKEKPVMQLAQELLQTFPGLHALKSASLPEILKVKGIGKAKAVQLKAALALASRMHLERETVLLDSAKKVAQLLSDERDAKQERLTVLLLNSKKELLHREVILVGTVSELLCHPREIFHLSVKHFASSIIIAHNHPSGDPTPSKADIENTRRLELAANVMGIPLIDHIIIARNGYVSLREKGVFKFKEVF